MTPRSIHEPTRHAAITPSGTASRTEMKSVITVSVSVGSSRWPISSETGCAEKIELPEIAAQQLADPGEELDQQRLVESQLGADLRDIFGRGEIAGDDRGRIAGREMQQREDEHGDDHDHRHGRQQAADQEDMHDVATAWPAA